MALLDVLTCRSPRACAACEHWTGAHCELERQISLALAPRAAPARARRPRAPRDGMILALTWR